MNIKQQLEAKDKEKILKAQLDALLKLSPRLKPIAKIASDLPLREMNKGFHGMSSIICSQMLSVASANAIFNRLIDLMGEVSAERFLRLNEAEAKACGLSQAKYNSMLDLAKAELDGLIDYQILANIETKEAIRILTQIKGVGTWSAEIYLLFCEMHQDIFPSKDLVLQKMLKRIFKLKQRPNEKETRLLVEHFSPYKSVGARLLWRYYAILNNKEGIKLA